MNFTDLINQRYSVRGYKPDAVENEKLMTVLNAARLAPTASNNQPFRIIIIKTEGRHEDLLTVYQRDWFVQAPLILCICGLPEEAWTRRDEKKYLEVDAGIVMDHLVLAATEVGLGTCIIAAFNAEKAKEVLTLPDGVEPLLFTPLGYAADSPKPKERKPLEILVHYDRW
jgi:nitroreductase